MASTQLNTYYVRGNREGLVDQIAELFADDTPLIAMSRKVPAIATRHEWQDDALASASKGGFVEGAAISYVQPKRRNRNGNYTHIRVRNWDVTFTQLAVSTAGVKDDVAREVMKALKAIMTDYESIFLNTGNTAVGASGTARKAKGLQKAIITNTAVGTGAGNSADIQLTEDNVNLLLQKIWQQGGDPRALFCHGHSKRVISKKFSAKNTYNIESSTRKAIANITQYEGSFGTVDIVPDRFHMKKRITITTPDLVKVAVLRDITQYKGAATASSVKGWVEGEMTLQWGNEKGHAKHKFLKTGGTIA